MTENQQNIDFLLKKATDLISSKNLAQLENIDVILCQDSDVLNYLDNYNLAKINAPQANIFLAISISQNNTIAGVEELIDKLEEYEFILFNINDLNKQMEIIKKYAPIAKIKLDTTINK